MNTPSTPPFNDPVGTWNQRFSSAGYLFGEQPNTWLQAHASLWSPGERVLCVADGEGRNSVWLARQGLIVDAFDLAPAGVSKARQLASRHGVNVHFSVAACDDFAWPVGVFDGVAAIFVQFADPAMRQRLFTHMVQSLRPGGKLLLLGYTPRQLEYKTGGPPLVSHLYTEPMLREAFAGLKLLELLEYETDLAEGQGHLGRSALIGLVAQKP